jgi:hypothetical protein
MTRGGPPRWFTSERGTACTFLPSHLLVTALEITQANTLSALFVLARFPDGRDATISCTPDPWPISAVAVPSWADS